MNDGTVPGAMPSAPIATGTTSTLLSKTDVSTFAQTELTGSRRTGAPAACWRPSGAVHASSVYVVARVRSDSPYLRTTVSNSAEPSPSTSVSTDGNMTDPSDAQSPSMATPMPIRPAPGSPPAAAYCGALDVKPTARMSPDATA